MQAVPEKSQQSWIRMRESCNNKTRCDVDVQLVLLGDERCRMTAPPYTLVFYKCWPGSPLSLNISTHQRTATCSMKFCLIISSAFLFCIYRSGPTSVQPIAFTVFPDVTRHYSDRQIVLFRDVSFNSGNAFDLDTSAFTCPITGVYVFTLVQSQGSAAASLQIMSEMDVLFSALENESEAGVDRTWLTTSGTVVSRCNGGQRVWIQSGDSGQVFVHHSRKKHTVFVGFLLMIL